MCKCHSPVERVSCPPLRIHGIVALLMCLAGYGHSSMNASLGVVEPRVSASLIAEPDRDVNALFILLHWEGRAVTLGGLESVLPPHRADGYSMAKLSSASRSLGLLLDGVKFVKRDRPLDRSAIAFLKDAKGGHFIVLRPVGSTGTLVQVAL